jgi:hypothetical protein
MDTSTSLAAGLTHTPIRGWMVVLLSRLQTSSIILTSYTFGVFLPFRGVLEKRVQYRKLLLWVRALCNTLFGVLITYTSTPWLLMALLTGVGVVWIVSPVIEVLPAVRVPWHPPARGGGHRVPGQNLFGTRLRPRADGRRAGGPTDRLITDRTLGALYADRRRGHCRMVVSQQSVLTAHEYL